MTSPAHTEDEFRRLVEPHRAELHAHCYRMLGSVHDAEDALQEALLRAWRGLGRFEGRSSLRSWLYRIATNTSLDLIARRPKRVLPADHGPPSRRRRTGRSSRGSGSRPTPTSASASKRATRRPRPATSGARASSSRSSPPSSTCPPGSAPSSSSATCSASPPARRRDARDDRHRGQQRAGPRAARPRGAAPGPQPAGDAAGARRRRGPRRRRALHGRARPRRRRRARGDARAGRRAGRCRRIPGWYAGPRRSPRSSRPARCGCAGATSRRTRTGSPPSAATSGDESRGEHVGWVIDVLTLDGPRVAAVTSFIGSEGFPGSGCRRRFPDGRPVRARIAVSRACTPTRRPSCPSTPSERTTSGSRPAARCSCARRS